MTLSEFAALLDAEPKWVLNTTLGSIDHRPHRYSLDLARRLTITRVIHTVTSIPLMCAFDLAQRGLDAFAQGSVAVVELVYSGEVGLTLDIGRILSSFSVRLSVLHTIYEPRQLGRPPATRRDKLKAAADWGIDLSLLADNLRKTVEQRVRQLDGMARFASSVARAPCAGIRMFEAILAALVAHGIRFVLVGGVAATVQGSARFTNDIDLCYDSAADNIDRLVALLTEWHAYLRGVEPGLPFILDARTFRTTPLLTLTTTMGAIDLFDHVPGVGDYARARAASEAVHVGDTAFRALTLEALIASKKATRRKKSTLSI